jgi:branched-chain amino acid transport system substrate-binding protein
MAAINGATALPVGEFTSMPSRRAQCLCSVFVLLVALASTLASACGAPASPIGTSSGNATPVTPQTQVDADIVIAANLPLSGDRADFGRPIQLGYAQAVDEVNAAGGITVDGTKRRVQLKIADDQSDGALAASEARDAFQQDNAVAMLGAANPPLNNPISAVAEDLHKPLVISNTLLEPWLGARPQGYLWSWDIFFSQQQRTQVQFQAADLLSTNKRVALFTDTAQDGISMAAAWQRQAPRFGYTIVAAAQVPAGTTDFSEQVRAASAAQAEIVIAKLAQPDAVALWKEMNTAGYVPKAAFCEECAIRSSWFTTLGPVGAGTMNADWWSPSLPLPRAKEFVDRYAAGLGGENGDLSIVVSSYSAASVLLDAIAAGESTQPEAIRDHLSTTDKSYPVGPVKFTPEHTSPINAIVTQWGAGPNVLRVWPTDPPGAATIESPPRGLEPAY